MLWKKKTTSAERLKRKLNRKYRRYRYRWIRRGVILAVLLGIGDVVCIVDQWQQDMPKLHHVFVNRNTSKLITPITNVKYTDTNGKVFYQTNVSTYKALSIKEVLKSQNVVKALLATEDRDFYHEGGFNPKHFIKAAIDTYLFHHTAGGSTITQQLIKLSFFSTSKKDQTVKRKYQEIRLANQLTKQSSKNQILTWYLNSVNFSNNQQGIYAASQYYYRKKPQDLNLVEAATLVGIVNSPEQFNPYTNPQATQKRRNVVLESMYAAKYISRKELKKSQATPLSQGLVLAKANVLADLKRNHQKLRYADYITAANSQLAKYATKFSKNSITVQTTLNRSIQHVVSNTVKHAKYPDKKLQEAVVVLDNKTGNVIAMSGGRNQTVVNGYNRALDMKRSSGSSIKPLLDYAPAFELFGWNKNTIVNDGHYNYPNTTTAVHDWDNAYQGNITVHRALIQSRNIPAVKTLAQVGLAKGRMALKSLGLPSSSLYYANAIGLDVTPVQLASAYTSLANYGKRSNAKLLNQIYNNKNGNTLKMQTVHEQVFSPSTAYQITKILEDVFSKQGTGARIALKNIHQAGKTGTVGRGSNKSQALTDAWMAGYTKQYTVVVWVGYDNAYGKDVLTDEKAQVGQKIYQTITKAINSKKQATDWAQPKATKKASGNFMKPQNWKYSYLPFYLNMMPKHFIAPNEYSSEPFELQDLYQGINQTIAKEN